MAKAPSSKTNTPPLPETYEQALQELEQLVGTIESGAMPLDDLLSAYQRGAQLLSFCRARLDAVDQQVRLLDGTAIEADREDGDA